MINILKRARNCIKNGWVKNDAISYDHSMSLQPEKYDIVRALVHAGAKFELLAETEKILLISIREICFAQDFKSTTQFNDHRLTTKEDVLAVFDLAIKYSTRRVKNEASI